MTEFRQTTSPQDETTRRAVLVAQNIGANNLLFLVLGIYLAITTGSWQAYGVILLAAEAVIGGFASASLIKRGRQNLGAWLLLITDILAPALAAWIIADFSFVSIAYIAVSTFFIYTFVMSKESRLAALVTVVIALIVPSVAGLTNVSWKLVSPAMLTIAPILTSILAVVFLAVVAYQAWTRNTIRSRFLTISLGLTLISTVVIAAVSVSSLLSAGEQAQTTSSEVLRKQAQDTLVQQAIEFANQNDLILEGTSQDAGDVAQQAATILENPNAFNTESFWNADEHMFLGGLGQYINSERDISSVFVPNTVKLTDSFKKRLELLAYLDVLFVPVYESDPNSVAIYFVGRDEISWLHPNINLGALVPPDYLATQDIFYTIGAPENNPEREIVWTPVYDDPGGQGLLVSAIAPVYTSRDVFMGVIGIDISLAGLTTSIEQEELASGGYSFLLDADGRALALPEQGYNDFLGREREAGEFGSDFAGSANSEFAPLLTDMLAGSTSFQSVALGDRELFVAYTTLESTGWRVASVVSAEQVLAPAAALQTELGELSRSLVFQRIVPIGLAFVVLVVIVSIFFTNRLVNPIEQLTEGASKIGRGEWDTPLPQSDLEEIGGLSNTLGNMAAQLKNTLGLLEQRVAARTRDLEIVAEVGTATATILESQRLLQEVVDLTKERFNLYHSHIYLLDEARENLVLASGAGEAGRQMLANGLSLPIDREQSLVARAARERKGVTVNDVTQDPEFLPNPLLPDTRSELAVPMIVGGNVIGVFDIQSEQVGRFTDSDVNIQTTLAAQLATSIQNVRSFEQSKRQAELQSLVNVIGNRIQRTTSIEETLQTAIRELGTAIGATRVKAKVGQNNGSSRPTAAD